MTGPIELALARTIAESQRKTQSNASTLLNDATEKTWKVDLEQRPQAQMHLVSETREATIGARASDQIKNQRVYVNALP